MVVPASLIGQWKLVARYIEEHIDTVLQEKAALFDHLMEGSSLDTQLPWSSEELLRVAGLS